MTTITSALPAYSTPTPVVNTAAPANLPPAAPAADTTVPAPVVDTTNNSQASTYTATTATNASAETPASYTALANESSSNIRGTTVNTSA